MLKILKKNKKYKLTNQTMLFKDRTLYRIQALINFGDVEAGDLGGWIESEENLSQNGNCWIYDEAKVYDKAKVFDSAKIYDYGEVYGNAYVHDYAIIKDKAKAYGNAWILNGAVVCDEAYIQNNACICNNAMVCGDSTIYDAFIGGCAVVNSDIKYNSIIKLDADIHSSNDFITIGPIGSRNGITTFFKCKEGDIGVSCGCFSGYIDEFLYAVKKTHYGTNYEEEYIKATEFAKSALDNC